MSPKAERLNDLDARLDCIAALRPSSFFDKFIPDIFKAMELNPFKPFIQFIEKIFKRSTQLNIRINE